MRIRLILVFFFLAAKSSFAQTDDKITIYGDFAFWKSKSPSDLSKFKKIDSLIKLQDTVQVIKIIIGGDYDLRLNYQRFYFNGKEWRYDTNLDVKSFINSSQLSKVFSLLKNQKNEHETYVRIKNQSGYYRQNFFYFVVNKGVVIKSVTTSVLITDIPQTILTDDDIFLVFK